jgi:hypothetical protein
LKVESKSNDLDINVLASGTISDDESNDDSVEEYRRGGGGIYFRPRPRPNTGNALFSGYFMLIVFVVQATVKLMN